VYQLSTYEWHAPGAHAASRRIVMRIAGPNLEMASAVGADPPTTYRGTVQFGADGAMSISIVCPRAGAMEFDRYAVTTTGVALISTAQNKAVTFVRVASL
jgi:hypothetical protein